jgi:ribosomal protein L29
LFVLCIWFCQRPLGNPVEVVASAPPTKTPEAAAAEVAAKRTNRAVYWFIGVAAAAVMGTLFYPQLVTLPANRTPGNPAPLPPVIPPANVDLPPSPKPSLSAREELVQRVDNLKGELAELRKQKRSQLVDMKKRGIKDEIIMIETGLKKLDKA